MLTSTESAILDLYDEGLTPREIAAHGFNPVKVAKVTKYYGRLNAPNVMDDRHRQAMLRGSRQLLAAILGAVAGA